jgi:hypothetical protein
MKHRMKVYVGFSDGVPHVYACEEDGESCVAVYAKRKDVAQRYEDVRVGELTVELKPKRRRLGKEVTP